MKINKPFIIFFTLISVILIFFVWFSQSQNKSVNKVEQNEGESKIEDLYRIEKIEVIPDSTYGILMSDAGVSYATSTAILEASKDVYDLVSIRVGRTLDLYYDRQSNDLVKLVYQIDSEDELIVSRNQVINESDNQILQYSNTQINWVAERVPIPYDIQIKISDGVVATSLYQAALDNNTDVRAIIELADAYQWTIDFAMDPRVGDSFKFIYEERYRDGEYVMPGRILASSYVNSGTDYRIYYFEEDSETQGYYDPEGNSVQKELLKAPIQYKYISSGFTTGLRCLEAYNLCTNHRAIDYAAPLDTPIRAVGDGTVVYAGWSSVGYGNLTSIRHNDTYTTNYAHQSKIVVKYGQKVKQGDIIGYVGSTGLSTGHHLHYEVVKYGTKINPLTLDLPPGKPIKEENRVRFFEELQKYQEVLK